MEIHEKRELSRRFAEGYRRLLLMTDGKPPPEWLDLQRRLMDYRKCVSPALTCFSDGFSRSSLTPSFLRDSPFHDCPASSRTWD
jgi:hypothetical protein